MTKITRHSTIKQQVADYMAKPYARLVIRDDDATFRAEIVEFPGCMATGVTAAKALESLEDVAHSWLEATIEKGQRVPEPIENDGFFSGKLMLRLPKTLHRKAAHAAARDGVSLNQFIVTSIAEQVGRTYAPSANQQISDWTTINSNASEHSKIYGMLTGLTAIRVGKFISIDGPSVSSSVATPMELVNA